MKLLALAALAAATLSTAAQADFARITSEEMFRANIADRTLVDEFGGTRLFGGNGGLGGRQDSSVITGGWIWHEGALCHRTRIDGIEVEQDCALLWMRGNTVVMQTKRGRSTETVWKVH
ncbi:hypothetical protein [Jannaschia seohaensis]|uniref:Uncharacterized protein n=1 Tax=Jannaschia seohaensis TaxID=475081 RepID=A0A2Y9AUK6_9RHOB|nr:hypothetical protein [Jannaschia seohaensis]PWJ19287.1 hypothetical protein BCF38_104221 [Jannaschia seohaensis]SSA45949.1 hypothetical protein SAMN05421539_104221 [Jannaschia seohaensis]